MVYDRCCHGERRAVNVAEKAEWVITTMDSIVKHLDIPTSLRQFGVPESDLETLVASGMEVTRLLNNNMRKITQEDARNIYKQVL